MSCSELYLFLAIRSPLALNLKDNNLTYGLILCGQVIGMTIFLFGRLFSLPYSIH